MSSHLILYAIAGVGYLLFILLLSRLLAFNEELDEAAMRRKNLSQPHELLCTNTPSLVMA